MSVQTDIPKGSSISETAARRPVLAATDITLEYKSTRGAASVTAVESVSLTIGEKEFVTLLGQSGCGKSSFLRMAAGLLRPSRGQLELHGDTIVGPRADVGIVFQDPTLIPWLTVLENVLLPLRVMKRDIASGLIKARELIDLVQLADFVNRYPHELSGGMKQRVAIARGLVQAPSLLLMDEPFAALDALTRELMMRELQRLWIATDSAALFVTHSIQEAVFLADRILVMSPRPGRIIFELQVPFGRPRTMADTADPLFGQLCNEVRDKIGVLAA